MISAITFTGYSSPLKTNWRNGNLPTVKKGFYGDVLTQDNLSLEHLRPHSKGGKTDLANLVLASKSKNRERSNKDINEFINMKTVREYLSQFTNVRIKGFNGNNYIDMILRTLKKLGVNTQKKTTT